MQDANQYIDETRDGLIAAVQGLTPDQWNFKPAPQSWSIAQNLEHVVIVQERVLGPIGEKLAAAPPAPADHPAEEIDAFVVAAFADRSEKFQGPEAIHPTGGCTPDEALRRLDENCRRLKHYLQSTPDLRRHAIDSLPLKALSKGKFQFMDGYQWLLAAAAHTERHRRQILEVKASAGFPACAESRASVA